MGRSVYPGAVSTSLSESQSTGANTTSTKTADQKPTSSFALMSRDAQRGYHDSIQTATVHAVKKYQVVAVVLGVVIFLALVIGVYFLVRTLVLKNVKKYKIVSKKDGADKSDALQGSIVGLDALELGLIGLSAFIAIAFTFLFIERKKFVATKEGEAVVHYASRKLADTPLTNVSLYGSS